MGRKRVIIIDNDIAVLEILEHAIKKIAPDVCCLSFVFADEAIRVVKTELITIPDYIFINVDVSRVTAPECLRVLTRIPKLSECKIIMFAQVMPNAVGKAFIALGAFDFFQKPVVKSSYKTKIKMIFDKTPVLALSQV